MVICILTCVSPSKSTTSVSVNLISISFVHWFPFANNSCKKKDLEHPDRALLMY